MKLKGINPFEQHVDKAVLGISGAAFLGVLAMQFLTSPNEVKVGNLSLPPENAFQPAEDAAKSLTSQMATDNPSLPEVPPQEDFASQLRDRLAAGVAPRPVIRPLGQAIAFAAGQTTAIVPTDLVLGELAMPAPTDINAATHRAAIDPIDKVGIPGLAALLPSAQPYDKATVSIQGKFDGRALRALFETDPDDAGPQSPLPLGWWRDAVEVVAVEVEREKLQSDGNWSETTVLPSLPGRVNLMPAWDQVKTAEMATQGAATARTESSRILRPAFYRIIAGPKWIEPAIAAAMADKDADQISIDKWRAEIKQLDIDIPALQQQIDSMPREEKGASRPPANEGRGGGAASGGRAGGGRAAPPPPSGRNTNEPKVLKRWQLEEQLRNKNNKRRNLVARLKAAGVEVEAATKEGAPEPTALVEPPLLDNSTVKFWTHDLTAEAGATYRYRTRLVVNNPVFGRGLFLKEEQKSMAEKPLARTAWSDWSSDVQVDADQTFFVTGAAPRSDAAIGQNARATVEAFKFYYGAYRRASVSVEPGDTIVAEMKLPAGLLIYDETKLPTARPDAPAEPGFGPGGDPRDSGGGGGGRAIGGGRAAPPPPPPPTTSGGSAANLPPGEGKPGPERLSFSSELMLLGVAGGVQAEGGSNEAIFRRPDGMVIARSPEAERTSDAFKRLESSARLADEQAKPKVNPNAPAGQPQDPRDPRDAR